MASASPYVTEEALRRILGEFRDDLRAELRQSLQPIQADLADVKGAVRKLQRDMIEVKGFQRIEARTIEHELQRVLHTHLQREYPLHEVVPFPMKVVRDVHGRTLTDLDAAFVVRAPEAPDVAPDRKEEMQRLGIRFPARRDGPVALRWLFVMAEAKHHLTRAKVVRKLYQAECFAEMLRTGRGLYAEHLRRERETPRPGRDLSDAPAAHAVEEAPRVRPEDVPASFLNTVLRFRVFQRVDADRDFWVYFGASYWEGSVLKELQTAARTRRELHARFQTAPLGSDEKVALYHALRELDREWLPRPEELRDGAADDDDAAAREDEDPRRPASVTHDAPAAPLFEYPTLTEQEIRFRSSLPGILDRVRFVLPSGQRYEVEGTAPTDARPTATVPVSGGGARRTPRRRRTRSQEKSP